MSKIDAKLKKFLACDSRDPAINLNKIRVIDLYKKCKTEDIEKFINDENATKLLISSISNNVMNDLKKSQSFEEFIYILEENNIKLSQVIIKSLKDDFNRSKKDALKYVEDELIILIQKFNVLKSEANSINQSKNIYTLHVGTFYLKGTLKNSKSIYAPIICYEVSIEKDTNKNTWIEKISEPFINEKLFQMLNEEYGLEINSENFYTKCNGNVNQFIKYLETEFHELMANFKLNDLKINKIDSDPIDELKIINNVCIGLMQPKGGSIKKNIEQMIEKGVDDPFDVNNKLNPDVEYKNHQIEFDDLIEINRPLNIYQKYAVQSALNDNTLIYGPPGTGKSEVIATIIANIIHRKKNILMSSEKQAALNVLRQRLGPLKDLCLFIYDSKDKNSFYECLLKMESMLKEQEFIASPINNDSFNEYCKLKKLIDIFEISTEFSVCSDEFLDFNNKWTDEELSDEKHQNIFAIIDLVYKKNENEFDIFVKLFNQIKNVYEKYKSSFDFLLTTKFEKFTNEFLNDVYKISEKNISNNFFWEQLLFQNKIVEKQSFFKKLFSKKVEFNCNFEELNNLIHDLKNINNLNILNKENIQSIIAFESNDINDIYYKYYWYKFKDFLKQNNFDNEKLLHDQFYKYVEIKKTSCKLNADKILGNYISDLKDKYSDLEYGFQKRIFECLNKAKLQKKWDINKLIKRYYDVFELLFPVWILSPENACNLIPLTKNKYNYGVFDEASQMFVENSYPLIYRCKYNTVAGDNNQMPPSNWFSKSISDEEVDIDDEVTESLLEKAETCSWPKFYLKNHYRSQHQDLISFSNENVYNNELEFFTRNGVTSESILVYNVKGIWTAQNTNPIEAEKIIDIIQRTNEEYRYKKILIVTFNNKQSAYLEQLFCNRFLGTDIFKKYDEGLIVIRNLENVQGDEADIVILSVSYGRNSAGQVYNRYGALIQQNGYKRLNVAITRAKEKMIVVKSLYSSDIRSGNNLNTEVFRNFIAYIDWISDRQHNKVDIFDETELKFESDFEKDVYDELIKYIDNSKYKLLTQLPVGKKRIDLAVYSIKNKEVVLGIEVDGWRYHCDIKQRLEDLDRQNFLEDLGYNMFRITEIEWKMKKEKVIDKIKNYLRD